MAKRDTSGDSVPTVGMFKVVKFSGGSTHPFTGEHYYSQTDPEYQFTVTFYPYGESASERDNRMAGFDLRKPHVTVAELVRWTQSHQWRILSISELRSDAAPYVGRTATGSVTHAIRGDGWHYDRVNYSECGVELVGVEHKESNRLLQITCKLCI